MMMDPVRAEFEIRQLHARYADAVFRQDIDALVPLFAEDAQWRVGGRIRLGREAILEMMRGVFPQFQRILMIFGVPIVHVSANEVTSRAYVTEQSRFADGRPFGAIGIYFDRFVEEQGRLVFKWRLFQTQYSGPPGVTEDFYNMPDYGAPPAMPPLDETTIDRSGVGSKAVA